MLSLIFILIFFVVMIGIGVWGMKKTTSLNDFFLGGRSIGPWISAVAYGTSYFSAVLFIGFAGKLGWGFGLNVIWIVLGNAFFGSLLAWLVLGRRTRRMTQNLDVMTMPEFLQERFQGRYMKLITASIIFIFLLPYSASVFKGLGHLFEVNFNISYDVALLIMIVITGIYLILGGYFAITLTDFIQGIIMVIGSLAMLAVLVGQAGGFGPSIEAIKQAYAIHVPAAKQPSGLMLFSLLFMTSFGVWGLPQMVQKFYAVKSEKVIRTAAIVTTGFALIIVFAAYFNGALAHVFYDVKNKYVISQTHTPPAKKAVQKAKSLKNTPRVDKQIEQTQNDVKEQVKRDKEGKLPFPVTASGRPAFDRLIPDLLKSKLPEVLMALIMLLVLSASMSTLSSLVLVSASSVAIDMYKGHVNPNISKENSVAMMRFLSGIFIVLSFFIARYEFAIIVTLMSLSWGAVAGSFMAPFMYGLYWKGTTRAGAKAGMITGLTLAVALFFILGPSRSPIASTIAMIVPFFVVPAVSKFTRKPADAIIEQAFEGIGKSAQQ